ncbi:MAG TPA: glycosyltransferase family 39 protein [Candidatus Dormibacteraeota bacterium]|nr:glycosyltransferase family 39 protein [Candidatus Dormibacteraeota bacterium]
MATAVRHEAAGRLPAMALAASVAVLIVHLPAFAHRLLDGDEAVYASIAALLNEGATLYGNGGVDNKPPGIFWTYAATFDLFGTYQMTAVHIVGLVVTVATCALLFVIGRSISGDRAGLLAATFYGLLTATGNPRLLAANTELFMTLPLTAAFLLMLRRQWLWSGLLMVVAGAFKQVAAAEVLMLPVGLLLLEARGARVGAGIRFAAGIAAGVAAGAAILALTGSLPGFWRWTVETLAGYAAGNWSPGILLARSESSLVPFVVSTIVLWVAAGSVVARWRSLWPAEKLAVAWLVTSFVGALAGGHWSWHYFIQVMAPLALLAALAIDRALKTQVRRWVAAIVLLGVIVPAAGWTSFNFGADPLTYDWSPPIAQHEQVAEYIRTHTNPGDRVFVWGDWPALYVESDRLMSSRFPGFLRGFARGSGLPPINWDTAPDVWPALQSDLERNPPQLIIDTSTDNWSDFAQYPMVDFPVLRNLVASSYHPVATVDDVVIYARNT